jgi:hypothetical protein
MKNALWIVSILTAIVLAIAACSGISGQSPVGNKDPLEGCGFDLSGEYECYTSGHDCLDSGFFTLLVTQSGTDVTVDVRQAGGAWLQSENCWQGPAVGTVDCETRTITATTLNACDGTETTVVVTISESGAITGSVYCSVNLSGNTFMDDPGYTGSEDTVSHCDDACE